MYVAAGAAALLLFVTQRQGSDTPASNSMHGVDEGRGAHAMAAATATAPRDPVVVVFCISGGKKRFIEEGLLVSLRSVRMTSPACLLVSARCTLVALPPTLQWATKGTCG